MPPGIAFVAMVRGSMRRRGKGAWELRVYRGVDPATGRQVWATKTVRGSRRHASAELRRFAEETGHARLRAGSVGELLERWFETASPHWAAPTVRQTRSVIDCHLIPHLGHMPVTKLTTADIDDFYGHLLRAGGRDARPLAPGTVHRIHVVLHPALAQAVRCEWIWVNPASNASPPRVEPAEIRPPTAAQVARLLESVRDSDFALFVYLRLATSTGARRSQLLALRWADVDLDRGAISFTRALVEGPNGPELRPTKTRRAYRVALDADTLAVLAERHPHAVAGSTDAVRDRFVFSLGGDGARPWKTNFVTKRFIDARRTAGLAHFRLHDLRHFMATQMLAAGVPIATVSARLSHARARRRRSTSTRTRSRAPTATPPRPSPPSSPPAPHLRARRRAVTIPPSTGRCKARMLREVPPADTVLVVRAALPDTRRHGHRHRRERRDLEPPLRRRHAGRREAFAVRRLGVRPRPRPASGAAACPVRHRSDVSRVQGRRPFG